MKKLLSAALVIVMSLTFVFAPVSYAATINMNGVGLTNLLDTIGKGMPATTAQRTETFNVVKMYLSTDANMDNLIGVVKDLENYATNDIVKGDAGLKTVIDNLVAQLGGLDKLTAQKDEIVFALSLLRALPKEDRDAAVAAFSAAANRGDVPVNADADFQAALTTIYEYYVSSETDSKLAAHGIGANNILRLSVAFKDNVLFTDGNGDAFGVDFFSGEFESRLNEVFPAHFAEINGIAIDGTNAADAVIAALVDVLNSLSGLEYELKTVLGDGTVDLYTAKKTSSDDSSSSSSSSSGTVVYIPGAPVEPEPILPPAEDPFSYNDTANHWANDYITSLSKRGIFTGYEDGSFRPDQKITREEIAVAMMRALGLEEAAANAPKTDFADGASISPWAVDAVNLMVEMGIFTGYDDNSFKPNQVITREELTAVLIRKIGVADADDHGFVDAENIGEWAEQYIKHAVEINLVNGYPDGSFKPANSVTRGETAKMLYGFLGHIG